MDNPGVIIAITFGAILILLATGMWISVALGVIGLVTLVFWAPMGGERMIGILQYNAVNLFTFTPLPVFIFMGEIILFSGLGDKLYTGASKLVGFLPGGLLHTNIMSCAIFAAVSGSSMATAATIGTVAVPELEKRGYNRTLLLGSLAAGGTLGILIPPSMGMIIYGAFVQQSIARLFIAGMIPGIILAGLFMTYIAAASTLRPNLAVEKLRITPRGVASSILDIWPMLVLILIVLGSIYLGIATPTESAAMGATASLVFCALYRKLSWQVVQRAALGAIKITAWAMLIVIGARILTMGLSMLKVPAQLADWVSSLPVDRLVILLLIVLLYILLGMFIEAISMILLTLPVVYPIIMALGFDPIWFGVMVVVFIEMGQITPPVGVNLYVIHGITGKRYLNEIIKGIVPFFFCMVILIILVTAFPWLATWLPDQMIKPWG